VPFQIYSSWFDAYKKHGLLVWQVFGLQGVWFPHAITLVIGVTLFILQIAGAPLVQVR
jgi:hypothetical protein